MAEALKRWSIWIVAIVAVLIAAITLAPAEIWSHPSTDQQYKGFDPALVFADNHGGSVSVSRDVLELDASSGGSPAVTLLTTPLQRIDVSVTATIVEAAVSDESLQIGLWSPFNDVGYFVVFGGGDRDIAIEQLQAGTPGTTLTGATVSNRTVIGAMTVGMPYRLNFTVDRARGTIRFLVLGNGSPLGQEAVTAREFPKLFQPARLSLTASSAGHAGPSRVRLDRYQVTLLHERFWTSKVEDSKVQLLTYVLALASSVLIVAAVVSNWRRLRPSIIRISRIRLRHRRLALGVAVFAVYFAGNALLWRFSGHPFDMGGARLFTYIAAQYGPAQLYYLPNTVSLASIWQGTPYLEAGDPYGPISSYLFGAVGWINAVIFGHGTPSIADGFQLEALIKGVNVLFGFGDGLIIYWILRQVGASQRWSLAGSGLFLFNPAVWFSMSVWGQTHVISVFFALAAILFIQRSWPTWAWLSLVGACLTRPQMLLFALLLGIVLLRRFGWRTNVSALSWTAIGTFLFILPLSLQTSPTLPVDLLVNNFHIQEGGGNDAVLTTVTQGAYSIWPLLTYLSPGTSSMARLYTLSQVHLIGPLTYQLLSQILTGLSLVGVSAALIRQRRETMRAGGYIPLVTIGVMAFLMFLTGIVSTHFLLALPLIVLCRPWMSRGAYLFAVTAWSVTTLITMFGSMAEIITVQNSLMVAPFRSLTDLVVRLYSWDRVITVGVTANVCALGWLAWLTFRHRLPDRGPDAVARA